MSDREAYLEKEIVYWKEQCADLQERLNKSHHNEILEKEFRLKMMDEMAGLQNELRWLRDQLQGEVSQRLEGKKKELLLRAAMDMVALLSEDSDQPKESSGAVNQ